jgi:hypothetical protein
VHLLIGFLLHTYATILDAETEFLVKVKRGFKKFSFEMGRGGKENRIPRLGGDRKILHVSGSVCKRGAGVCHGDLLVERGGGENLDLYLHSLFFLRKIHFSSTKWLSMTIPYTFL